MWVVDGAVLPPYLMIFFEYHSEYVCFYNYWKTFTISQVPVAGQEARRKLAICGGFCEGASECKTELCCNCTIMRYLTCDHDILQVIFFHITGDHFLDVWTGKSYFQSGLLVVMQSNICGRIRYIIETVLWLHLSDNGIFDVWCGIIYKLYQHTRGT